MSALHAAQRSADDHDAQRRVLLSRIEDLQEQLETARQSTKRLQAMQRLLTAEPQQGGWSPRLIADLPPAAIALMRSLCRAGGLFSPFEE